MIDNRPGAGGNVGLEVVARAAPDGYTLLASPGGGIVMAPHLSKLAVNVDKDILPISPTLIESGAEEFALRQRRDRERFGIFIRKLDIQAQ